MMKVLAHDGRGCSSHAHDHEWASLFAWLLLQGVVAFFPSFAFAGQALVRWGTTGVLSQLAARKSVFQEPKAASDVEALLQQYAAAATGSQGQGSSAEQQHAALVRPYWAL